MSDDTISIHDDCGQLSDFVALVLTCVMAYGAFWVAFEYFYLPEESIVADGILAVRGVFLDVLGPTRGAGAFLAVAVVLALLLNAVVFTDYIGPDMMTEDARERTSDE